MNFKNLILILAIALLPFNSYASRKGSPFQPHDDIRFDEIEDRAVALEPLNLDLTAGGEGQGIARKFARAVYDVAVDGGSSTVHDTGVDLPAGAVITAVYVYINTAFTDGGTGSVRLNCVSSGDLMAYSDLTAISINQMLSGGIVNVAPSGGAIIKDAAVVNAGFNSVPTACSVVAEVRSDSGYVAQSTGKFTAIIEYFDKD